MIFLFIAKAIWMSSNFTSLQCPWPWPWDYRHNRKTCSLVNNDDKNDNKRNFNVLVGMSCIIANIQTARNSHFCFLTTLSKNDN